jgi:hypothetical protein
MRIHTISRAEFDRFEPCRHPDADSIFEETDWFADGEGVVIGVVTRDRRDDDWAYAVLGRDAQGTFRAFDNDAGLARREDARQQLVNSMERALATGLTIFL